MEVSERLPGTGEEHFKKKETVPVEKVCLYDTKVVHSFIDFPTCRHRRNACVYFQQRPLVSVNLSTLLGAHLSYRRQTLHRLERQGKYDAEM